MVAAYTRHVDVEDHGDEGMVVTVRGQDIVERVAAQLDRAVYDWWSLGLDDALADQAGNLTAWTVAVHGEDAAHELAGAIRSALVGGGGAAVTLERGPSSEKECPHCGGCGMTREEGWS